MRPWLPLSLAVVASAIAAEPQGPRHGPPDWAEDAVWYEIHPDRFRNGDPKNDPGVGDLRFAWPYDAPAGWRLSPWTADWYKLQPWEKAAGRDFYALAPLRRYGGDLQGIIDRLGYLQSLGVTALLLDPIFEAPSAARYDPSTLHHVDNNLGPDPDGDRLIWATENPADPASWKWTTADRLFLRLVQECHRRQMKLVLEATFDHVGATFWAFRDVRAKGRASRYADWFAIRTFDDPRTAVDELDYSAALGVHDWPELRAKGDSLASGARDYIRAVVKRWGDPNADGDPSDGVDGWRIAADRMPRRFVRELRGFVLGLNPEAVLMGRLAPESESGPSPNAAWLRANDLDIVANDQWASAARAFFIDRKAAISASDFTARLGAMAEDLALGASLARLDLLDGADEARIASQVVNPDRPLDPPPSPKEDPRYDVRAPKPDDWRRVRLLAAFQFASPGAPALTYGTEAGMWGAAGLDHSKPMVWKDLVYEDEAAHPLGQPRRGDPVRVDEELLKLYQWLGKLRAAEAPLRRGSFEPVLADDARRVMAFARASGPERVVAAFNDSEREVTVDLPAPGATVRDLLSTRQFRAREGRVSVSIPPLSAVYLAAEAANAAH